MTARDDLTALVGTPTRGLCPRSCRDTRDGPHVHNTLDAIASLATDPETAPVVFRWLVEAGVVAEGDQACDCENVPWPSKVESGSPWNKPWHGHYHAVLGER